ncbi:hypothetical protein MKW94_025135 [Papaver nudicaule]|uniref:Protein Jade-1 n=1 Tax=Papaver nudicaule TaxID=74823 RepID=A0AA41VE54_PAPNU|nr:hypothetical protein [Papaver nudicaule]
MESTFHEVHPLKRFKLKNKQEEKGEKENLKSSSSSSKLLPAKKRMKSLDLNSPPKTPLENQTSSSSVCLPAKKRVWAIQPISPEKPIQLFDLNLDYQQSPEKTHKKICLPESKSDEESEEQEINGEENLEEEAEEEDDGIVCDVCKSTDGDPSDPIVLCDGCDLMVHSTCYGNPLIQSIPEGDWFCCTCQASKGRSKHEDANLDCCLCPVKGGALKPTTDNRWAHITCALLVPEVFFRDPEGREDIDCSRVPSKRFREVCYVCRSKNGCVIECSEPNCRLAFHVTCGLKQELSIEFKEGRNSRKGGIVAGFCKSHTELWEKQQQTGKYKIVARDADKK